MDTAQVNYSVNFLMLQEYSEVTFRLRGNADEPYKTKHAYFIDANKPEVERLLRIINREINDNRILNASVYKDGDKKDNLIEVESRDQRNQPTVKFTYTPDRRKTLEENYAGIETKMHTAAFFHAPEDTPWETLVNKAEYDSIKGFLFPADRPYVIEKAMVSREQAEALVAKIIQEVKDPAAAATAIISNLGSDLLNLKAAGSVEPLPELSKDIQEPNPAAESKP